MQCLQNIEPMTGLAGGLGIHVNQRLIDILVHYSNILEVKHFYWLMVCFKLVFLLLVLNLNFLADMGRITIITSHSG